jgi:hypothetical protein
MIGGDDSAFGIAESVGCWNGVFGAVLPAARALVHLRIADVVADAVARLTTDLPGSALIGWGTNPLGGN